MREKKKKITGSTLSGGLVAGRGTWKLRTIDGKPCEKKKKKKSREGHPII